MLRANLKWKLSQLLIGSCLVLMLTIGISGCDSLPPATDAVSIEPPVNTMLLANNNGPLAEVNTPASILQLAPSLDKYQPQVQIISPTSDEILPDDRVTVKLKVSDLPLFKQPELGLGNHLHVILDKQTYQGVYDLSQPLVFKNLAAGTHTLRVFASRPWHESFKNQGAFDLVTFHVLTKTAENQPNLQQPILTYSRPAGTYGAEPIMLDYYLANIPDLGSEKSDPSWRVRVTINDRQFSLDRWAPIYLQGFKQGKNWVRLELIDKSGNPIANVYNDTLAIFTYDPQNRDALAKLTDGELSPDVLQTLVDPRYVAIAPPVVVSPTPSLPKPAPADTPVSKPIPPTPALPPMVIVPPPEVKPAPKVVPSPAPIAPIPEVKPKPSPALTPEPIVKTLPSSSVQIPEPIVKTAPDPVPAPIQQPIDARLNNSPKLPIALPTPTATPIIILPAPTIAAKPALTGEPTKNSPPANPPVEIAIPQPIAPPQVKLADKLAPLPVKSPAPVVLAPSVQIEKQPIVAIPPAAPAIETSEKTWQTQTSELFNVAKAKIRTFTNTIPAKAERFGRNLQIWSAKAMELIEQLRDRG